MHVYEGDMVVGVSADEASRNLQPALSTLDSWGVDVKDVQLRGAFAFVAQKDYLTKTVQDKMLTQEESLDRQPKINAVIRGNLYLVYTIQQTSSWHV